MRRFARRNFQITTELYSKLSYTPCYTQCGLIRLKIDTKHYKKLFKNVGGKFNSENLYIIKT
jgi:hypothetical protein